MDDLQWYQQVNYKDAKTFIKDNINTATNSFIAIGYYLKHIRDNQMYTEDGYTNVWDLAQSEFGISRSSASRFISICEKFSVDGDSPLLMKQYKDFSNSKLQEMLTLTDDQLEQVTIGTTVAEIREIKQPEKPMCDVAQEPEKVSTSKTEIAFPKVCKWDGKSNCVAVCDIGAECCGECTERESCNGRCGWADERMPKQEADGQPNCFIRDNLNSDGSDLKCSGDILDACNSCDKYEPCVEDEPEQVETVEADIVQTDNPLSCRHDSDARCLIAARDSCKRSTYDGCMYYSGRGSFDESDETGETDQADVVQAAPEVDDDPEAYTAYDVGAELDKLTEYVNTYRQNNDTCPGRRKAKMRLDAIALLSEDISRSVEPVQQPGLPILKNNDQRKEFIEAYATWPIWIDLEQTGERYYRYNLSDSVAIVVKVSKYHGWNGWQETTKTVEYGAEQYYLLGVKCNYSVKSGSIFQEDPSRTFYECSSNKSALVDYLKEFQKKG